MKNSGHTLDAGGPRPTGAALRQGRNRHRAAGLAVAAGLVTCLLAGAVCLGAEKDRDLSYDEYQALTLAAHRLDKLALLEPNGNEVGMYLVLGDRYGLVHVFHMTGGKSVEIWKSKFLDGIVEEVLVTDLDGDGYNDAFAARTNAAMIYVWSSEDFNQLFESLTTEYERVHAFTTGNVDEDDFTELIINADRHIYYVDGKTFNSEWTSPFEYEAARMRCGDVDGDDRNEIVLSTGQILDPRTGDVEWEDEVFGSRIELLDVDGDGIPEVLTESDGTVMKIYDIDHRKEKFLQ